MSRYDGKAFTTFTVEDGLADNWVSSIVEDRQGHLWVGTAGWRAGRGRGGVSRYDGQEFVTYTTEDGLAHNYVWRLWEDRQGNLWVSTLGGGVSRFDGEEFATFTTEDGLAGNDVRSIGEDRQGNLWVGTYGGVSRYDGQQLAIFTTEDGLADNSVTSIVEDRQGNLWFGSLEGGVSRYDGTEFTTFATEFVEPIVEDRQGNLWFSAGDGTIRYDGTRFTTLIREDAGWLVRKGAASIAEDRQGNLWFGTTGPVTQEDGVLRYDGQEFITFTTEDGLADNSVTSIVEDRQGNLWFGTEGGVSRYDGKAFTTFTTEEGLAHNYVTSIAEDPQGNLWFGTWGGGVSAYDGIQFTTLTTKDGLSDNHVRYLGTDRQGHIWISTLSGVRCYDGLVLQTLSRNDGLLNDRVGDILQDRRGDIWFSSYSGLTRYRPQSTSFPTIHLTEVVADRAYESVEELRLPSSQAFVTFEFQGRSLTTRPDGIVYVYRLQDHEDDWRTTRMTKVKYTDLPKGNYVFQVKAVDRDFNYSEPVEVRVSIHPPYGIIGLVGGLGIALVGLALVSGYAIRKRRDLRRSELALMRELEEELQTAHDMQMGLMPNKQPRISGFDIAGRCLPANHVGGDFFQYFDRPHNRLAVSMADVTGHAMEAAIPVVMFSGILDNQMETGGSLEDLFAKLNRSMHRNLDRRNFVCFAMGEIDPATRSFRVSNGGCPFPYHFQAANSDIVELQVETYPLGVQPDTTYQVIEVQLEPGDYIVFCSDGIAESRNAAGELFGFERTAETVRQGCVEGLSATALIDRLISDVQTFSGDNPQEDDQTIVVVGVET